MEDITEQLLKELSVNSFFNSLELSSRLSLDHQKVVGAIKSLQSLGNVIESCQKNNVKWSLTEEGKGVVEHGSHEAIIFNKVPKEGSIEQSELLKVVGGVVGKVGFSKAMSLGWIGLDKKAGGASVFRKIQLIEDKTKDLCKKVSSNEVDGVSDSQKNELKKRKLINELKVVYYEVKKGEDFTLKIVKQETELTQDLLHGGLWKEKEFKTYNFASKGLLPLGGHLHPLLKVRTQFRQIFLEMGFTEMPTNNFVESSFWNFDALFQPQQHPARDAHDTFFISDPVHTTSFPMDYLERVKKVHSQGGFRSIGYNYDWRIEEARKNILRTHTTGVSARMLYQLATMEKFTPVKFFSIDRVFRNETLDATHLAEFHQIEGLVADYHLTLGDLMGYIKEFFKKYGITKLKFKPAYNPYTEPSMEIFSFHEGLKKWVEIGNSGVFRPEMLLPMGLPSKVSVIAWGLSLERPTMIKYGVGNIRDLFGPKVDLQTVYDNPICILGSKDLVYPPCFARKTKDYGKNNEDDKENGRIIEMKLLQKKQKSLIEKMQGLREKLKNVTEYCDLSKSNKEVTNSHYQAAQSSCPLEVVLEVDPYNTPSSILSFILLIRSLPKTLVSSCIHSSLQPLAQPLCHGLINLFKIPEYYDAFLKSGLSGLFKISNKIAGKSLKTFKSRTCYNKILTVVWRRSSEGVVVRSSSLKFNNFHSILKYLSVTYFDQNVPKVFKDFYPVSNATMLTCLDDWMEEILFLQYEKSTPNTFNVTSDFLIKIASLLKASKGPYIFGENPTLVDFLLWSSNLKSEQSLKVWVKECESVFNPVP